MNQITVNFSDPALSAYVEDLVAKGAFSNAGEYVLSLISEDRKRRALRLEALLLEGLEGEATELTAQDWENFRQDYKNRHAQANGSNL